MENSTMPHGLTHLQNFYNKAIGKHMTGGATTGGYSALEDYGNSVYSGAKEKLIRSIAKDVSSMLKVSSSFADTADIKDVVAKLQRIVPDPKNKKNMTNDSNVHKELCGKLADSINKNYDMDIIDKTASPDSICNKVSEVLYSLFTGLHSEFLTISGDVSRIVKNLQILNEYVNSANEKLINSLEKSSGGEDSESAAIQALYTTLTKEIDRQQALLANLTSAVITPVGASLITLLEDNNDFKGLTEDISKLTGTTEFSTKLGFLLNGTSNIAHAAEVVDKALKKIGLTVAEYKAATSIRELREKVFEKISKAKPSAGEMYKLLAAADILYKTDMSHDDILSHLEKKRGGIAGGSKIGEFDSSFADAADIATMASAEDNPFKGRLQSSRKSITKQLNQKAQLRKGLFIALNDQIKDRYTKLKFSFAKLGKKIGSEVDLTPELDMFIRQLDNFSACQPDRKDIHVALSGYRKDVGSTWVKHQFMENLYAISETAEALVNSKNGSIFKDIKADVDSIIDLVVEFNKTFTNTMSDISVVQLGNSKEGGDCGCTGGDEGQDDAESGEGQNGEDAAQESELLSEEICDASNDDVLEVSGGQGSGFDSGRSFEDGMITHLGGVTASLSDSDFVHYQTMKKSIREIDYYYRIAGIKLNMIKTSAEFDGNVENYENILGEEGGYIIDQIQNKYNKLMEALEPNPTAAPFVDAGKYYGHGHKLAAAVPPVLYPPGLNSPLSADIDALPADKEQLEKYKDGYKFLLEYIKSSKVEMLEAAQSLDLYLSKFTKSMQFKPDQIKEFVQILEQIEVLAKWFTDKSGDNLVGVFESFSTMPAGPTTAVAANVATDYPITTVTNLAELTALNASRVLNPLDGTPFMVTGDHYYKQLAGRTDAGVATPYTTGRFQNARMMTRDQAVEFVKQVEKSIKSVRALENIIATFSRVNTSVSAEIKTFMSSGFMFKAFMKYAVASSISVGYLSLVPVVNEVSNIDPAFLPAGANSFQKIHAKMAVALRFNKAVVPYAANKQLELCDPLQLENVDHISNTDHVDICDNIFEMSIKSLISKIFTVVGSYSLFNRPPGVNDDNLSLSINPLRQILGGSTSPKNINIIPQAAELYIRLPLLVEWYRTVFEFKEGVVGQVKVVAAPGAKQDNPLISIIPDMDGIWGDICKVIFMDANNITDGAYPTDYANKIIESINTIYTHYTAKKSDITCRDILTEFVLEINRRYGFIMRTEIDAYFKDRYSYIDVDAAYPDDENVDYDLLDVESQIGRRPAPSDRFRTFTKKSTTRKFQITDLLKVAKRFRQSIEDNLILTPNNNANINANSFFRTQANASLTGIIAETTKKIRNTDVPEEKYRVVHEQLHGVEKFGDIDQDKMILFHETVATPMTVLYFTYLILNDFNRFCISLNIEPTDINPVFDAENFIRKNTANFKGADNDYKHKSLANINGLGGAQTRLDAIFDERDYANLCTPIGGGRISAFDVVAGVGIKFNRKVMEKLLRKVMNVGCDMNGLTEVNFVGSSTTGNYPYINYSKLEETCNNMFNDAKSAFHQLRKFLPLSIIQQYEDVKNSNVANRVSMFYIQEQLFDRLFGNKYGNGLVDANNGLKNIWRELTKKRYIQVDGKFTIADSFSEEFSRIGFWSCHATGLDTRLGELTGEIPEFPLAYVPIFKSGETISNPKGGVQEAAAQTIISGDIPAAGPLSTNGILLLTTLESGVVTAANPEKYWIGSPTYYKNPDNVYNAIHQELGLIPKFNAIIYKYCTLFIDKSTKKIYRPLVEKFINGHNAKDILNNKNINDNVHRRATIVAAGATAAEIAAAQLRSALHETEPQPNAIIFASISNALKGILMSQADKVSGAVPMFVEDSFLKISEYQKELYRTHLPAFEKELNLLIKKADFMRTCLEDTEVVMQHGGDNGAAMPGAAESCPAVAAPNPVVNGAVPNYTQQNKASPTLAAGETHIERKEYLVGIYSDISMSARSLLRCVHDVQKELNDVPMYFETYNESIVDYNSRNGRLPFMPISNVTHLMNFSNFNTNGEAVAAIAAGDTYGLSLIPQVNVGAGSPEFKFSYGTRGLLNYKQAPSMEFAPGVEAFLNSYNGKVGGAMSFDKSKMANITTNTVMLSRWVLDFMYHNQALCSHDWLAMQKLVLDNQDDGMTNAAAAPAAGAPARDINTLIGNLSCQTSKHPRPGNYATWGNTSNIVSITENDDFAQSKYKLLECIVSANDNKLTGYGRKELRIYNILDLNIVPINVHAMQREVPFVNLFNYSYTFDHIVKNFIGTNLQSASLRTITDGDAYDATRLPENILVNNLIFPLGFRSIKDYVSNTYRIMNGTTSMALNRPKYLSDQLWNKVLLNSIYENNTAVTGRRAIQTVDPLTVNEMTGVAPNYAVATVVAIAAYGIHTRNQALATALTFIKDGKVYYSNVTGLNPPVAAQRDALSTQGYLRYNSKLVRWIEWFAQLQRVGRLLMRSQLDWVQDPIVQGSTAVATEVTEFKKDKVFTLDDYN